MRKPYEDLLSAGLRQDILKSFEDAVVYNSIILVTRAMIEDDAYRQYMPQTATRDLAMLEEHRVRELAYIKLGKTIVPVEIETDGIEYYEDDFDRDVTPEEKKALQAMNLWDWDRNYALHGAGKRKLAQMRKMPNKNEIALRTDPSVRAVVKCAEQVGEIDSPFTMVIIHQTYTETEGIPVPTFQTQNGANSSGYGAGGLMRAVEVVKHREISLSIEELEAALKTAKAVRREFVRVAKHERRVKLAADYKKAQASLDQASKEVKRIAKESW